MSYRTQRRFLWAAVLLMAVGWTVTAAAQLPNVTYRYDPSFTYPVVPTTTYPGSIPVTLPATLPGNSSSVYWNFIGINNGTAIASNLWGLFGVDGEYTWMWGPADILAGYSYSSYDNGPINVRGGRHTLEVVHDDQNVIVESNENDNVWAHQFIFTPYLLSESTPKTRGTPPVSFGGVTSIVDGSVIDYNCDGFRFSSSGWWNVVTMRSLDAAEDYDLEIFAPSTGSENGFTGSLNGSYALPGCLDAVIANGNTVGVQNYDVGVINISGAGSFVIEQVVSTLAGVGTSMPVSFGTDEYLKVWDTWIGDPGEVTVAVTDSQNTGIEFQVGWIEYDATVTNLSAVTGQAATDQNGEIRLHRNFTTIGYYGLVVYRDPVEGGAPVTLTMSIEPTPPDYRTFTPAGWHSPLVPTPVPIIPAETPVLPDTLHGYMPQTYLNFGLENNSIIPAPGVEVAIYQDGTVPLPYTFSLSGFIAHEVRGYNLQSVDEFPGGRHVLTMEIDHNEAIHEIYEGNNIYAEQYCWSPLELSLGWQYGHTAPGDALGGTYDLDPMEPIYYNCDGYRLYTGYSEWEGMVLTQGPNSDYDLSIHYALSGVKDGFDDFLAGSAFYEGDTDYVLFNNQLLPAMAHDIGVESYLGDEPYTVEAVGSTNLPIPVGGHHGPYTMPISNMLHLYNIYLEADVYAFRLDNLAAPVDWGFSLHPHDVARQARQDNVVDGTAYLNGPGDPEMFTVHITAAGYYGLAVFKATPFGFDVEGEYRLTIMQGVSDVTDEPDLPVATALTGVHPNPFNPQTTISYDLSAPAAVELNIYDLKGALVRRLVSESRPAGRHEAVWNGKDDTGSRAASGVYLARLVAGEHRDITKLVMVK